MKKNIWNRLIAATLLCAGLGAPGLRADDRPVRIHSAVEVEFESERGHYYQLQRSTNLIHWENVEDAIYGHGGRDRRLFPAHDTDRGSREFYRVVVTAAPTNGVAPWSFAGLTLSLDDSPSGDVLQFLTETNGLRPSETPPGFQYTFSRTSTNEVRVEAGPPGYYVDRKDIYVFTFTAPGMGTWVRDEYRKNQLKDRDVGVFHVLSGGTNSPAADTNNPAIVPTEIPSAVDGLAYTFQSGEHPTRLEFTSTVAGTEFGDDAGDTEPNLFTYVHSMSATNAASITITRKPGEWDEYVLVYSGPARGTFVRREFKDGALVDTDSGAFNVVVLPAGSTQPPAGSMPTNTLSGLTYTMNDGSPTPVRLVAASDTAGTQYDDSAPTQFTYAYTVTGPNAARLVVTFKPGDKWDEYTLVFTPGSNSGTFTRKEYDRAALKDTDTGIFTGAPSAP